MADSVPGNLFDDDEEEDIAEKVVDKMKKKGLDPDDPADMKDVYKWFPREDNSDIRDVVDELIDSDDAPVKGSTYEDVYLRDQFWDQFSPFDGSIDQ